MSALDDLTDLRNRIDRAIEKAQRAEIKAARAVPPPRVSIESIMAMVSRFSGVHVQAMTDKGTGTTVARARTVVMLIAREAGWSTTAIGSALGRDHTTVIAGCHKILSKLDSDYRAANLVQNARAAMAGMLVEPSEGDVGEALRVQIQVLTEALAQETASADAHEQARDRVEAELEAARAQLEEAERRMLTSAAESQAALDDLARAESKVATLEADMDECQLELGSTGFGDRSVIAGIRGLIRRLKVAELRPDHEPQPASMTL